MKNRKSTPTKMTRVLFSIAVLLVLFQVSVQAQDTELVSKKQKVPAWLDRALGDANQLEGGLHVYQDWTTYNSDFKTSRVKIGMLIAIIDPAGNGSEPSKLYQLKEWAETSAIPEENEWEELSLAALPGGTANNTTLRWNGSEWVESAALTNDSTDIAISGILTLGNDTVARAGIIQLADGDSATTGKVAIQAPDSLRKAYTLTLPDTLIASKTLVTDETGNLSWKSLSDTDYPLIVSGELEKADTIYRDSIVMMLQLKMTAEDDSIDFLKGNGVSIDMNIPVDNSESKTTARIAAVRSYDNDNYSGTQLSFQTRYYDSLEERMKITEDGRSTITQTLTGDEEEGVALTLKGLPFNESTDLKNTGSGIALGFAIPASNRWDSSVGGDPYDTTFVGGLNEGALVQTAKIAAQRTASKDNDLDTRLAFYTRKDGVLGKRAVIDEYGLNTDLLTVTRELTTADTLSTTSPVTMLDLNLTDTDGNLDLHPGNGVAIDMHIPVNNSTLYDCARIAAQRTDETDTDADTELGFYTRKDGNFAQRFTMHDNGDFRAAGNIISGNDTIASAGAIQLADNNKTTTRKVSIQAPDSLRTAYTLTLPDKLGAESQTLITDANGNLSWGAAGDNLGNHIATNNMKLDTFYISGDGNDEGISIDNYGAVTITRPLPVNTASSNSPTLSVNNGIYFGGLAYNDILFEQGKKLQFSTKVDTNTVANEVATLDSYGNFSIDSSLTVGASAQKGKILLSDGSSNKISIISPAITTDYTLTLPTSSGASGQFLKTNGSGALSWAAPAGDNLGNHTATQNIELGSNYLSNNGGPSKGLSFDTDGNATLSNELTVKEGQITGKNNEAIYVGYTNGIISFFGGGTAIADQKSINFDLDTEPTIYSSTSTEIIIADDVKITGDLDCPSDQRLKKDIKTLPGTLDALEKLRGVSFEFKDTTSHPGGRQLGVIAQELQKVFPELVHTGADGYLSVSYIELIPVLLQALKEENEKVKTLEKKVDNQQQQINNIMKWIKKQDAEK